MHIDVNSPLERDAAHWARKINSLSRKDLTERLKIAAIFASFAAAILTSAYAAYANPAGWCTITAAISLSNLYAMPKILHHGNAAMIKYALSINLTALSSIFMGGLAAAIVSMSRTMMASLKIYQFSTALFCAFGTTALLGYGVPLCREAMEKAYQLLIHADETNENIKNLGEQFHNLPEMGLGLLQSNLWQSFALQVALIKPDFVFSFWDCFLIDSPDYVWSIAAATVETISLEGFQRMLDTFREDASLAEAQNKILPVDRQENYQSRLKVALKRLDTKDLKSAAASLLESGSKFIPHLMSNEQFLELFIGDPLNATNELLQTFLDQAAQWPSLSMRHGALEADILKLEQDILQSENDFINAQPAAQDALLQAQELLSEREQHINKEFIDLRAEIEKTYINMRVWQNFAAHWSKGQILPFEHADELLDLLHNQTIMNEIDKAYRSMIGTGQGRHQTQHQTLGDQRQLMTNKVIASTGKEDEEEPLSVIDFLSAKKGFIVEDFYILQERLDLDSPHELEEALASIGLQNEEDFYRNNILEPQDSLTKSECRNNLLNFIEKNAKQKKLSRRIEPLDEMDRKKRAYELGETVSRVLYHAISSGLIMVPILIHPYAGISGFVIGSIVFILKRFGIQRAVDLVNLSNDTIESVPGGISMRDLIGRRIFSLTPLRREEANRFVSADFFGRMRMINVKMIAAIFISYLSMRLEQPYLGSFLQGVSFAHEVVHLV